MNNLKNIILCACTGIAALSTTSCDKGGGSEESSSKIVGSWELISVETKSATIGDIPVTVNLTFNTDGSFSLQQLVGEGRSTGYSGTYSMSGDKLSGTYSDGKPWADTYTVAFTDDKMDLTTSNGKETDTYKRK